LKATAQKCRGPAFPPPLPLTLSAFASCAPRPAHAGQAGRLRLLCLNTGMRCRNPDSLVYLPRPHGHTRTEQQLARRVCTREVGSPPACAVTAHARVSGHQANRVACTAEPCMQRITRTSDRYAAAGTRCLLETGMDANCLNTGMHCRNPDSLVYSTRPHGLTSSEQQFARPVCTHKAQRATCLHRDRACSGTQLSRRLRSLPGKRAGRLTQEPGLLSWACY
jgi:hypothetical protein